MVLSLRFTVSGFEPVWPNEFSGFVDNIIKGHYRLLEFVFQKNWYQDLMKHVQSGSPVNFLIVFFV